jgi:hypothetical protein
MMDHVELKISSVYDFLKKIWALITLWLNRCYTDVTAFDAEMVDSFVGWYLFRQLQP